MSLNTFTVFIVNYIKSFRFYNSYMAEIKPISMVHDTRVVNFKHFICMLRIYHDNTVEIVRL